MIATAEVMKWGGLQSLDTEETAALALVVDAVNVYVEALPSIDRDLALDQWAGTTRLGAIMLAARIYRRKNSPGGIESVGDTMTFVSRYDSDISRLLNIDSFRKPSIG